MTTDYFGDGEACVLGRTCKKHNDHYYLTDPRTGEADHFQRVSTLKEMPADMFHISQWRQRNIAIGVATSDSLRARVLRDPSTAVLNDICEDAHDEAGGNVASELGTDIHDYSEKVDLGDPLAVPEEWRGRLAEYTKALADLHITVLPEMIERCMLSTRYEVAGRFDRVVRLADGTYAVADLKTGKSLSSRKEFAIQTAIYADGFNTNGVWDEVKQAWHDPGFKVREDFGLIIWLPAKGKGCKVKPVRLDVGRQGADLAAEVRAWRKSSVTGVDLPLDAIPVPEQASLIEWMSRIGRAGSRKDLEQIAAAARIAGDWGTDLRELVLARLAEIS